MMRYVVSVLLAVCMTLPVLAAERNDIHSTAEDVQPLLPGMSVPGFTVLEVSGEQRVFDPANVSKPLVITFFRGGWCPYCNLHLSELRHAEKELKAMGFDIWFISADRPELLYESLDEPDIGYTILSDGSLEAARTFGIAFKLDEGTLTRYEKKGIDLLETSGENHQALPVPATFIVGTDGEIHFEYTNPDFGTRLHPDLLVMAAKLYKEGVDKRLRRQREQQKNSSS